MLALPSAAAPAPRRQLFVGTAVGCVAAGSLIGAMLALWMRFRTDAMHSTSASVGAEGHQGPDGAGQHDAAGVRARSACSPSGRSTRPSATHAATPRMALGLVGVIGVAIINAQAFIYAAHEAADQREGGDSVQLDVLRAHRNVRRCCVIIGIGFSAITAFRYLGGRTSDREIVSAHALYWYFLSAVFFALWFVVYVTK